MEVLFYEYKSCKKDRIENPDHEKRTNGHRVKNHHHDQCDNCPGEPNREIGKFNREIKSWHELKLKELSDLSILGLIECFTESAPQLMLQLYIMFNMGPQYGMLNHICKYRSQFRRSTLKADFSPSLRIGPA